MQINTFTPIFVGETLPEAVKREVFEETGVKTEFISLVCFRHFASKGGKYGCSDIYFVAHLKPIGGITDIKICPREIEKACWMPVSFFCSACF